MRKAIVLVLLIVLGTMPLQTSAQVSVPAVDLQCVSLDGEIIYEDGVADNSNASSNDTTDSDGDNRPYVFIDTLV